MSEMPFLKVESIKDKFKKGLGGRVSSMIRGW